MPKTAWKVQKSTYQCYGCQQEIAEGQAYFSRLAEGEEEYERSNHCLGCWNEDERRGIFWKTKRAIEDKRPRLIGPEELLALFLDSRHTGQARKDNFRYLLCLLLLRKRRLKVIREASLSAGETPPGSSQALEDEGQFMVLIRPASGENPQEYWVLDPKMSPDELAESREDIQGLITRT